MQYRNRKKWQKSKTIKETMTFAGIPVFYESDSKTATTKKKKRIKREQNDNDTTTEMSVLITKREFSL